MQEEDPARSVRRMGRGMLMLAWLLVLGMLTWFFQTREDAQRNPNRSPAVEVLGDGTREVVLERNRANHYVASGRINGRPVEFLLDTGATRVVVPEHLAAGLGLARGMAGTARTANGDVRIWDTRIARLELGSIVMHDVRASISAGTPMREVLLGMSALGRLELEQVGNELRLRAPLVAGD